MFKSGVILVSRASGTFCTRQLSFGRLLLQQATWSSIRHFSLTQSKFISKAEENQSPSIKTSQNWNYQNDGKMPAGGWFLLVIPVSTLALGIWQVFRWRWKLGLIAEMRRTTLADPVPLPRDVSEIEKLEYRKVQVKGEFDYSNQVLIGPRALVSPEERTSERQMSRGVFSSGSTRNGYHIITPFKVEGNGETILVNRGWVESRNFAKYNHVQGSTEIVGIVRKTEQRSPFITKSRPGENLLHFRDVPAIAETLKTGEIWLDLHSLAGVHSSALNTGNESVPVPGQTRVAMRNEHVSYFVTWFSLSAITGMMWHRLFIRGLNLL